MPRSQPSTESAVVGPSIPPQRCSSNWLREIDMFFEGRGEVHQTMRRLVRNLKKAKIPYAIAGGMAVNAHRYERMTKDVDVLLTREGFAEFQRLFVPKDYERVAGLRRFIDRKNQRSVDVLLTGR